MMIPFFYSIGALLAALGMSLQHRDGAFFLGITLLQVVLVYTYVYMREFVVHRTLLNWKLATD